MEIGIDIEENSRFENVTDKFLQRVFSAEEIKYAKKFEMSAARFCAMWCAKEAVVKAFADATLAYSDIEILREPSGKPFVKITEKLSKELSLRGLSEIKISLSHSHTLSTAICILN